MIKTLEIKPKNREIRPTAIRLLVLEVLSAQETTISLSDLEKAFEKAWFIA